MRPSQPTDSGRSQPPTEHSSPEADGPAPRLIAAPEDGIWRVARAHDPYNPSVLAAEDADEPFQRLVRYGRTPVPNHSAAIKNLLLSCGLRNAAELVYSHYSGIAHGVSWAIVQQVEETTGENGGSVIRPHLKTNDIVNAAVVSIYAYLAAVIRFGYLKGRDMSRLDGVRLQVGAQLLSALM